MSGCIRLLHSVLASAGRTTEELGLAWIAGPHMALVMRKGEFVPMLRTAYECAMSPPNDRGSVPITDRSTRIGGAECPPRHPFARAHWTPSALRASGQVAPWGGPAALIGGCGVAGPTIAVAR